MPVFRQKSAPASLSTTKPYQLYRARPTVQRYEEACPPGLRLGCHLLKKSQRGEGKAPAAVTRQGTRAGDGDTFGFPACNSHEVLLQATDSTQGTGNSGASPPPRLDKEDMTGERNPYLDEHETKAFQNGVRNLSETVIVNDQYSTNETDKQFMKYKDKIQYESLYENNYSAESYGTGNTTYIANIKIPSAPNVFTDNVPDDNTLDVIEDGNDFTSSKSNVFYPPPRRPSRARHLRAVDEPSTSLRDGSDLSWKNPADEYHPVKLDLAAERQVHPLFSSFQFKKGVMFSIFIWVYLVAFVYAMCCILSSIVTPFSILGVIVKVLLVHYFPTIIRLEVFRAVDYIMTFIYNTFT